MAKRAPRAAAQPTGLETLTEARADGFSNALTGIGTTSDKRTSTAFAVGKKLTWQQCADIYRYGGLPRRIIQLPIADALRNWFRVKGDEENKVVSRLEELSAQSRIREAAFLARVFGGAIVLMGIDDGGKLPDPVAEDKIAGVNYLVVFDVRECQPSSAIDTDEKSAHFGEPLTYQVSPINGGVMRTVHHSRILRFDGALLPRSERLSNGYWHDSVFVAAWEQLRQVDAVFASAEFVVDDFVQHVIHLKGLIQAAASKIGLAQIKTRLQLLEQSRSVLGTMMLDAEETYDKATTTVGGLAEVLDRFCSALCAVCGVPMTRLFGISPAGLNSTGKGEQSDYADMIGDLQRNDLGPKLEALVRYVRRAARLDPNEDWSIEWAPIASMTPEQQAAQYKATAEADAVYINAQVAMPETVEEYRFGGTRFNPASPSWEIEKRPEIDPAAVEAMRQQQEAAKLAAKAGVPIPPKDSAPVPPGAPQKPAVPSKE